MSVKDHRGNNSLRLGKQRLGNDEDVIVLETDSELTSPEDDLPDISLHLCNSSKNTNSVTHDVGRPASKNGSCKGSPKYSLLKSKPGGPSSLSGGVAKTLNQKPAGRKQVQTMLKGVCHSLPPDVLVGSKSKASPSTMHSSKQHSSKQVQIKAPRVSKAIDSSSTVSSMTPQQHARKSVDCVKQSKQAVPGEQCNNEMGKSMTSLHGNDGRVKPGSIGKKGRVVTSQHMGTYKKGQQAVTNVKVYASLVAHGPPTSGRIEGFNESCRSGVSLKHDHKKVKHGHSKPTTSAKIAPVGNSLPVVPPDRVGPRNGTSSKMYPSPSTSKCQNTHSVMSKLAPSSAVISMHQLKCPPKHLPLSTPVIISPKHPLLPQSSSRSVVSIPSSPLPIASKQTQNHSTSISSKTVTASMSKDSETESSSMFDFSENDLFEVLDSVESESICSAYNQSDSESMDTAGEGKPTSDSVQIKSSELVKAATCKSPSESRMEHFTMSFMKRKTRQVARKSTTLNGANYFRHPLKGRGFLKLQRCCTLRLSRIHFIQVQRAKEAMSRHAKKQNRAYSKDGSIVQAACRIVETNPTLPQKAVSVGKKKRDSKCPESSVPTKRPKLSYDTNMIKSVPHMNPSPSSLNNAPLQVAACTQSVQMLKHSNSPSPLKEGPNVPPPLSVISPEARKPLPLILKRRKANVCSSSTQEASREHREHTQKKCIENVAKATSTAPVENVPSNSLSKSPGTNTIKGNGPPSTPFEKPLGCGATSKQRPNSTELTSPAVKKCLSLKRNRTQSLSEDRSECLPACAAPKPHFARGPIAKNVDNNIVGGDVPQISCKAPESTLSDGDNAAQPATKEEVVNAGVTTDSIPQQVDSHHLECRERSLSSSSEETNLAKLLPPNEAYDSRLMETIAKLAPESGAHPEDAVDLSSRSSSRYAVVGEGELGSNAKTDSQSEESDSVPLIVKLPLCKLTRVPAAVTTRALGMFKDKSVQVESGMIFDKDALNAYLVVKLHEAMFEMKTQLKMMEAQVASIAKQKESLERTLQAKTKYIRDVTTTGFKPSMVNKCVSTDPASHLSPNRTEGISTATAQTKKPNTLPRRRSVKTSEKAQQTQERSYTSISSQTEGVVHTVPGRLKVSSQVMCLYKHPESELQIFIDRNRRNTVSSIDDWCNNNEDGDQLLDTNSKHNWLSASIEGKCARSVSINPRVRFMRAVQGSSAGPESLGCPVHSKRAVGGSQSGGTPSKLQNTQESSDAVVEVVTPGFKCTCMGKTSQVEWRDECILPPVHNCVSKLVELYFRLKALPMEPVQENHMTSLLRALHHLLSHLPVELSPSEALKSPSPTTPNTSPQPTATAPPTSPSVTIPSQKNPATPLSLCTMTPMTPPSALPLSSPPSTPGTRTSSKSTITPMTPPSAPPLSSPPSTPGAATWSMGARLQELVDALRELEEKGREIFPKYFKAELAQLQIKVCETLTFLTVGLQHETFTHDQSGCIVDSDLHPSPWRDRDLQVNPYFHRLCLDVGVRAIMREMKRLMHRKRSAKRFVHYTSDEDSDVEPLSQSSLASLKRVEKSRTSSSSKLRKASTTKGKGTKGTSKSRSSKSEVVRSLVMKNTKSPTVFHVSIPSSAGAKSPSSAVTATVMSVTSEKQLSTSSTLTTNSVSTSTSTTPHASPPQLSPYNKCITGRESFRVRIGDLLSMMKLQPTASVSTETSTTVFNLTTNHTGTSTISTTAVNTNTSVVNSSKVVMISPTAVVSTMAATTSVAAVKTNTTMVSCTAATTSAIVDRTTTSSITTTSKPALAARATSRTPKVISAPPVITNPLDFNVCATEQRATLESLVRVLQSVQLQPNERVMIQKLIETAFQLTVSPYAIDVQMVQLLINQVRYQLHRALAKTIPSWTSENRSATNVIVQPILPIPPVVPLTSSYAFPLNRLPSTPATMTLPSSLPMLGVSPLPRFTASLSSTTNTQLLSLARPPVQRASASTTPHSSLSKTFPCITCPTTSATSVAMCTALSVANTCTHTSVSEQTSKVPATTTQASAADISSFQPCTAAASLSNSQGSSVGTTSQHCIHGNTLTTTCISDSLAPTSRVDVLEPVAIHHVLNPAKVLVTTCSPSVPLCATTVTTSARQGSPTKEGPVMTTVPNSTTLSTKGTTNGNQEPIISTAKSTTTIESSAALHTSLTCPETSLAREENETERPSSESSPVTISIWQPFTSSPCPTTKSVQTCPSTSNSTGCGGEGIPPVTTPCTQTVDCDKSSTCTTNSTVNVTPSIVSSRYCTPVLSTSVASPAVSGSAVGGTHNRSTALSSITSSSSLSTSAPLSLPVSTVRSSVPTSTRSATSSLSVGLLYIISGPVTSTTLRRSVSGTSTSCSSPSVSAASASIPVALTTAKACSSAVASKAAASTKTCDSVLMTNPISRPAVSSSSSRPAVSSSSSRPTVSSSSSRHTADMPSSRPTATPTAPSRPVSNNASARPGTSTSVAKPTATTLRAIAITSAATTVAPRPTSATLASRPTSAKLAPGPAINAPTTTSALANTPAPVPVTTAAGRDTSTSRPLANAPAPVPVTTASGRDTSTSRPLANAPAPVPVTTATGRRTSTSRPLANAPAPVTVTTGGAAGRDTSTSRPLANAPAPVPVTTAAGRRTSTSRPLANAPAPVPVTTATGRRTSTSRPLANAPAPVTVTTGGAAGRDTSTSRPLANAPAPVTVTTGGAAGRDTSTSRPLANAPAPVPVTTAAGRDTSTSRPLANAPAPVPVTTAAGRDTSTSRPLANAPAPVPVTTAAGRDTSTSRPLANAPAPVPVTTAAGRRTSTSRPLANAPAPVPVTTAAGRRTSTSRPLANAPAPVTVTTAAGRDTSTSRPLANAPAPVPVTTAAGRRTSTSRPLANAPAPVTVTTAAGRDTSTSRPLANAPAPVPVTTAAGRDTSTSRPLANTPAPVPVTTAAGRRTSTSRPLANTPAPVPVTTAAGRDTSTSRPLANTPAPVPVTTAAGRRTSTSRPLANTPAPVPVTTGGVTCKWTNSLSTSGKSSAPYVTLPQLSIVSSPATTVTSTIPAPTPTARSTAISTTTALIPTTSSPANPIHAHSVGVSCSVSTPISAHSTSSSYPTVTSTTTASCRSSSVSLPPTLPRSTVGQPTTFPRPQVIQSPTHRPVPSRSLNISLRQLVQQGSPPTVVVQASKVTNGLLIKWTFAHEHLVWQTVVQRYDLYAFVCNKGSHVPEISQWGKVGEIKPLALPMAVTLTNFAVGQCYSFAVQVNYLGGMKSRYSEPCTINL